MQSRTGNLRHRSRLRGGLSESHAASSQVASVVSSNFRLHVLSSTPLVRGRPRRPAAHHLRALVPALRRSLAPSTPQDQVSLTVQPSRPSGSPSPRQTRSAPVSSPLPPHAPALQQSRLAKSSRAQFLPMSHTAPPAQC